MDFKEFMRGTLAIATACALALLAIFAIVWGILFIVEEHQSEYSWVCTNEARPITVYVGDRKYCVGEEELELPTKEKKKEYGGTH